MDELLAQQKDIVDRQLGLSPQEAKEGERKQVPIGRRNWRDVAADFQKRERVDNSSENAKDDHWRKKISDVEAQDGVMGKTT